MQAKDVVPLPGFAFVEIEGQYKESVGRIIIPPKYRKRPSHVGRVTSATYKPEDARMWEEWGIVGKRVIVAAHVMVEMPFSGNLYRVPVATDAILAVLPDDVDIEIAADPVGRCVHCGVAKEGSTNTVMLDPLGFCPRCGKNRDGDFRDPTPKVTDEEVARFKDHVRRGGDPI